MQPSRLHGSGPGVTGWRNFRGVLGAFGEFYRCLVLETEQNSHEWWCRESGPADVTLGR